jgi:hypothetical protein
MAVGLAGPATVRRSNGSENGSRQDSPARMVDSIRYVNLHCSTAGGRVTVAVERRDLVSANAEFCDSGPPQVNDVSPGQVQ